MHMRTSSFLRISLAGFLIASSPVSGQEVILTIDYAGTGNIVYEVDTLGDVNGDGCDDILLGSPFVRVGGIRRGKVYVYSGRDGTLLWQSDLSVSASRSTGDLNGDHVPDLLAGRTNRERAHIVRAISGTDGEELWATVFDNLQAGSSSSGQLGGYRYPLRQVDDFDGDRDPEVFAIQTDGTTVSMSLLADTFHQRHLQR